MTVQRCRHSPMALDGLYQLAIRDHRLPRVHVDNDKPQLQVFLGQRLHEQLDLHRRFLFIAVKSVSLHGKRLRWQGTRRIRPSNDWMIQWVGYNEACIKDFKAKSYCNGGF